MLTASTRMRSGSASSAAAIVLGSGAAEGLQRGADLRVAAARALLEQAQQALHVEVGEARALRGDLLARGAQAVGLGERLALGGVDRGS